MNLTDGQVHDLTLYAIDWDHEGRSEQIQVINASTGSVLDIETISSFSGGEYLQWAVSGDVVIKVTNLGSSNAVISGLFLDGVQSATNNLVQMNGSAEGNWIGTFGSLGEYLAGRNPALPADASVTISGASTWDWALSTSDVRGLQNPSGSGRSSVAWYGSTLTINVNVPAGQNDDLALYAVDWDKLNRSEQIQVTNAGTGAVLSTWTISSFSNGEYLQWAISGSVVITVTNLGRYNAVISGLFLDASPSSTGIAVHEGRHDARQLDRHLRAQGYDIVGGASSLPSYATVSVSGASTWNWASSTTDPRGLEAPGGSGGSAACWYSASSFTIDVGLTDGQVHDLALYAVDWDQKGRSELIQVINAATGHVLDTEMISSFAGGEYLQWAISGSVVIKVTNLGPYNAVISGVFLDAPPSTASVARPAGRHDARQLDRHLRRAGLRHRWAAPPACPPTPPSTSPARSTWNWASSTTDPRGLEAPGGSGRLRRLLVQRQQLHDRRRSDRRPGARPGPLRGRLGPEGAERADPGHQRRHRSRAGHRDDLVVRRRGVPAVGDQRQRGDQGDKLGPVQRHHQRVVPRSELIMTPHFDPGDRPR